MIEVFIRIPETFVILHSRGVYKQAELWKLDDVVYAKHGGGFIKLMSGGETTAGIRWIKLINLDPQYNKLNYMVM